MGFLAKRQMVQTGRRGKRQWSIANNGEIQFTYAEARRRYGLSEGRFRRAIDELIRCGFIDIAQTSSGLHRVPTLYAISDRWRDFGTERFVERQRPRGGPPSFGFKPQGNRTVNTHTNAQQKDTQHKNIGGGYP